MNQPLWDGKPGDPRKHCPSETPTEGGIGQCRTCHTQFIGAILEDGNVHWIALRWWHRGFVRAKVARFVH